MHVTSVMSVRCCWRYRGTVAVYQAPPLSYASTIPSTRARQSRLAELPPAPSMREHQEQKLVVDGDTPPELPGETLLRLGLDRDQRHHRRKRGALSLSLLYCKLSRIVLRQSPTIEST